ncbi:DUF6585 family protein [Kitasatospora sp. NPDC001603]|uniref:DUF6585 family protein n=1 Tax=Kitasatospora sp. NPDC001603 TaxID=3154388 RepID=UPI00332BFEE0
MTGQDGLADGRSELLTLIDEAAVRNRLGDRVAVYPGTRSQAGSLGCAVTGAVVFGGLALVLSLTEAAALAVIPLGLLLLVPLGIWKERSTTAKNQGVRLDLHERGLTAVVKGRVHAVRYESTSVLQNTVRHTGVGGYTSYEYTLTDVDGAKVVLRGRADGAGEVAEKGRFSNPREWGPALQQAVTRAQLPGAVAALDSGGRLEFGRLWLTVDAVGSARESAQWQEIQEIKVFDGFVKLRVAGRWRALTHAAVSTIPNFFVFLALAEHLRRSAGRPAG